MDERLHKRERLSTREEYTRCYRHGERLRTRYFIVHAYHRGDGAPRLGSAVSKAIGNAVMRNRVKRRFRELFRRDKALIPGGYDVFVRALPASARATFAELTAAWGEVFALLASRTAPGDYKATVQPEQDVNATHSS